MEAIRFNSLIELIRSLPDEKSCVAYLEKLRWGDTIVSPYDSTSKVYKTKKGYRCRNTNKDFNVLTGTLMQGTKVLLIKWLMAMWLLNSNKKGLSSCNLAREIGVCQNTAWYMLHRLRKAYEQEEDSNLSGTVMLDESWVGGKNKNRHWDKKVKKCQGRAFIDKTPVFGMLQKNGNIILKVVPNTKAETLREHIDNHITKGSTIYTDEWSYGNLSKDYNHQYVRHAAKEYVYGDCTTNPIEGFWSIMKRGIIGIYQMASRQHLQLYADEFAYRYNTRQLSSSERFYDFLTRTDKRITYKQLVNNEQKRKRRC